MFSLHRTNIKSLNNLSDKGLKILPAMLKMSSIADIMAVYSSHMQIQEHVELMHICIIIHMDTRVH